MADRRRSELWGRISETVAEMSLRMKGYRIVATRYRAPQGEIDLIARRGSLLVFVEVKARRTVSDAVHAVTPKARKRIEAAARSFAARKDPNNALGQRFDIIAVRPWRWPVHFRDAWRPDFAQTAR